MFMKHEEEETQLYRIKCPVLTAFRTHCTPKYAVSSHYMRHSMIWCYTKTSVNGQISVSNTIMFVAHLWISRRCFSCTKGSSLTRVRMLVHGSRLAVSSWQRETDRRTLPLNNSWRSLSPGHFVRFVTWPTTAALSNALRPSVRPSVPFLWFTRNRKAVETSKFGGYMTLELVD